MKRNIKRLVNALVEATGEECTMMLLNCMAHALCDACETAGSPRIEFRSIKITINDFYETKFELGVEEET